MNRLTRRSRIPVLVVKSRVRSSYRNILVATDFSEPSRHALETVGRWFPDLKLTIFNAYDIPTRGWCCMGNALRMRIER